MASDTSQQDAPRGTRTYAVRPAVIGRRVVVRADLEQVQAFCDGELVADHKRIWGCLMTS
jgi:hypothetical protein